MVGQLADQIIRKAKQAPELSYRQMIVVEPAEAGKIVILKDARGRIAMARKIPE